MHTTVCLLLAHNPSTSPPHWCSNCPSYSQHLSSVLCCEGLVIFLFGCSHRYAYYNATLGWQVEVLDTSFDARSVAQLRAFQSSEHAGDLTRSGSYPRFLRAFDGYNNDLDVKQFAISVLAAGRPIRLTCTHVCGYGGYGLVFKAVASEDTGDYTSEEDEDEDEDEDEEEDDHDNHDNHDNHDEGEGEDVFGESKKPLPVAVKFLFHKKTKQGSSAEFNKMKALPRSLFRGHLVNFMALCERGPLVDFETSKRLCDAEFIVMELAENGDLWSSIVDSSVQGAETPAPYNPFHARRLTVQLIEAMNHMRREGFLHRDLKPENILFNAQGRLVLCDIGSIKDLKGGPPKAVWTAAGVGTAQVSAQWNTGDKFSFVDWNIYYICCCRITSMPCIALC